MASTSTDLPLGTSPENTRMHTTIRRVCYVLLFGLVLEGAVTFPLLAIWYGWPQLSPRQLCSGLQQVMYSDKNSECRFPYPLGETTSQDFWGIQPKPEYPAIGFRQLLKNQKEG
jgi:hypothetical protein